MEIKDTLKYFKFCFQKRNDQRFIKNIYRIENDDSLVNIHVHSAIFNQPRTSSVSKNIFGTHHGVNQILFEVFIINWFKSVFNAGLHF